MAIRLKRGAELHIDDATATHRLFASVKSRLVLPLWYRLTWVVPDNKWPLNGCVCVLTTFGAARWLNGLDILAVESLLCGVRSHTDIVVGPHTARPVTRCATRVSRVVSNARTYRPPTINSIAAVHQNTPV